MLKLSTLLFSCSRNFEHCTLELIIHEPGRLRCRHRRVNLRTHPPFRISLVGPHNRSDFCAPGPALSGRLPGPGHTSRWHSSFRLKYPRCGEGYRAWRPGSPGTVLDRGHDIVYLHRWHNARPGCWALRHGLDPASKLFPRHLVHQTSFFCCSKYFPTNYINSGCSGESVFNFSGKSIN